MPRAVARDPERPLLQNAELGQHALTLTGHGSADRRPSRPANAVDLASHHPVPGRRRSTRRRAGDPAVAPYPNADLGLQGLLEAGMAPEADVSDYMTQPFVLLGKPRLGYAEPGSGHAQGKDMRETRDVTVQITYRMHDGGSRAERAGASQTFGCPRLVWTGGSALCYPPAILRSRQPLLMSDPRWAAAAAAQPLHIGKPDCSKPDPDPAAPTSRSSATCGAQALHRLRRGEVPEHRRVLEPRHGDLHGARRHVHVGLRFRNVVSGQPRRLARPARAGADGAVREAHGPQVRRDHDGRPRRPAGTAARRTSAP